MHSSIRVAAVLSAVALSLIMAPGAGAAGWLPAFDLQADSAVDVEMTPGGDVAIVVIADGQYGFRFRPAGGPLGPLERPFPAGADGAKADVDAQGNTYFVWRSAGTVEARVRSRDGNLSPVQTIQAAGIGQDVAVTDDGRATLIWLSNDANRVGSARTRAANGDLGAVHQVTATGEKTRDFHVDVDADGQCHVRLDHAGRSTAHGDEGPLARFRGADVVAGAAALGLAAAGSVVGAVRRGQAGGRRHGEGHLRLASFDADVCSGDRDAHAQG